jgi:site-specific recombinase XerD
MTISDHSPFEQFLSVNDFAPNTVRALRLDFAKFVKWFEAANQERYEDKRVTPRDVADFRRHLREDRRQAASTINRALVTLRRYFDFLAKIKMIESNPAEGVKELRRVMGPPKAIERSKVRKLLREATVRNDHRGLAAMSIMLYSGLRVGEVAALELADIDLGDRGGSVRVRNGKGGKERTVPLPVEARKAIRKYLDARPPVRSARFLIGRGMEPLGTDGIRYMVRKYGISAGIDLHPHALRHTMATEYLSANANDLVGLAQLLGHESVETTSRYTKRDESTLFTASERICF